jgi:tetratricopeptide (TPR) repeat protein
MAKKPVPAAKPAKTGPAKPAAPSWRGMALLVLLITAACYLPSIRNGFVNWDDPKNITENENLLLVGKGQPWGLTISNIFDLEKGNVIGNYNPLPILTFALEKSLAGGEFSPTLTHSVNLLLHLLTVLMVMKVLWGMGIGRWGVALGGLLFGIHPMRVESVAWATERKDVLFAVFFFAALSYYIQWLKKGEKGENRTGTYVIMLVMALLSCFSKVQAVTLPLSMLALDFWFRRPLNFKLILEKTPFWALSLIFGLINIHTLRVQGSTEDTLTNYSFLDRLCVGAYSFCTYVYKALIPWPMSPLYAYPKQLPVTVYLAPLGFLAAAAGVWWAWKKGLRVWVFGAAFFFFNVMFLLQVFAAGQGFLADRFTYVAYFGLFAIAAYYADHYYNKENGAGKIYAALGIIAVVYGAWTVKQIGIWKDGGTLWTHVMSLDEGESERSSLPYWNRGQFLRNERGDYDGALKDYTRAVEMDPTNPELLNSRGKTYFDMAASGKFKSQEKALIEKAIKDYTEALAKPKITPKSKSEALSNRGAAYGLAGMYEPSIRDITESIALDPSNKNAYANRSIAYLNTGQYEKALEDYQSYLKFDPNNPSFWYESGMVQRVIKRNADAIKSLDRAIQLKPGLSIAWRERARAKAQAGDKAGAQADYQRAAQLGSPMEASDQQLMSGGN